MTDKEKWQMELREEEVKAVRKAARANEQRKFYRRGYVSAIAEVCVFFIKKNRRDIAQALLEHYDIDQAACKENQVDSLYLNVLEKANVFDMPEKERKSL